jgi:hypothetical protein
MEERIRAERDRFAVMTKALGGITVFGDLPRVPSVFYNIPKDLIPSLATATKFARDRSRDWNVVPPPPGPIKVVETINLDIRKILQID